MGSYLTEITLHVHYEAQPVKVDRMQSSVIYTNPVRISQETHYVSTTEPNRLMLFRETVTVYCENHTEHTNTLCEQNVELFHYKAYGTDSYQWPCHSSGG
jgi:hypothetical protein